MSVDSQSELLASLERLYRRHTFGIKFGLHVEEALLAKLGNPERELACIHVAGTNGKGSVCALLDAIFTTAGLRTGRYTSPHLVRFNERICVDRVPITDEDLLPLVARAERAAAEVAVELGQEPTFFEVSTAIAFEYFRQKRVNVVLLEVGMGGRLDATNVVTPVVSVITSIGLDHMAYLGKDLESIAREKCGIIKPGRPVVSGVREGPARGVIRAESARLKARLVEVGDAVSVQVKSQDWSGQKVVVESAGGLGGTFRLPLLGPHQAENLAVALATVEVLSDLDVLALPPEVVKRGVAAARWPGRLEVIGESPRVVVDGAHNPPAAERFVETLRALAGDAPVGLIAGFCGDKDVRGFLQIASGLAKRVWFVPIANERNIPADALRAAAAGLPWKAEAMSLPQALEAATAWARTEGGVVAIAGSLFLVGEVLGLGGWDKGGGEHGASPRHG